MIQVPNGAYWAVGTGDAVGATGAAEAVETVGTTEAGVGCGGPVGRNSELLETASALQKGPGMQEGREAICNGARAIAPSWLERTELLVGQEALGRLRSSTVVVAGLGGVGAYAAEMVARAGVGRMIIIDSDRVSVSNKNRQLLAMDSTVGRLKTEVMAARLRDINPELEILEVAEYLTEDNIATVLEKACAEASATHGRVHDTIHDTARQAACVSTPGSPETCADSPAAGAAAYAAGNDAAGDVCSEAGVPPSPTVVARPDFLIDAIDTLAPKIALIAYCVHSGIPLVSSMGAGAKLDATKVRLTDLSKSYNCPLAFILRKKLRKIGINKGFPVVFSEELPDREAIVPTEGERNKKSQVGTISYIPAVFGCVCAQAAISSLLEKVSAGHIGRSAFPEGVRQ